MSTKSIGIIGAANQEQQIATAGTVPRRALLAGAAGAAAAGVIDIQPAHAGSRSGPGGPPLWRRAAARGVTFGTATSTRLFEDQAYSDLVTREAAIVFTEDDLLWYKLKPTPDAPLDFTFADQLFDQADRDRQLVFAAHLVWDEGFGDGWTDDDLWGLGEAEARTLLFDTQRAMLRRYRGRVAGWIVANEVTDPEGVNGIRTNVPWYETIGPSYVPESFHLAREEDPDAVLALNEFGFETTNEYGDDPVDRQQATLQVIDALLADQVPLDALGVQAHLLAQDFSDRFDRRQYTSFLSEVADRRLSILITELDVLDDGLPADSRVRDRAIGDIYSRYLDVALAEPAVKSIMAFGLSDRYTWLEEDYPREDGSPRRPLPYDADLKAKPAYRALRASLTRAPRRPPLWTSPRRP